MDKEQIKVNNHLEELISDATPEGIGYLKRFIEYYELKGFNVKKFKEKQIYRENLMLKINCN